MNGGKPFRRNRKFVRIEMTVPRSVVRGSTCSSQYLANSRALRSSTSKLTLLQPENRNFECTHFAAKSGVLALHFVCSARAHSSKAGRSESASGMAEFSGSHNIFNSTIRMPKTIACGGAPPATLSEMREAIRSTAVRCFAAEQHVNT